VLVRCWLWMSNHVDTAWMSLLLCVYFYRLLHKFSILLSFLSEICTIWMSSHFDIRWNWLLMRVYFGHFFHEFNLSLSFFFGIRLISNESGPLHRLEICPFTQKVLFLWYLQQCLLLVLVIYIRRPVCITIPHCIFCLISGYFFYRITSICLSPSVIIAFLVIYTHKSWRLVLLHT